MDVRGLSIVYIVARALYRFIEFWRHWYVEAFWTIIRIVVNILERLDRIFAVKINFRYLFHPLYQDYTFVGRILGFIFRGLRILTGSFVYAVIIIIAALFYVIWIILPLFVIYRAFNS